MNNNYYREIKVPFSTLYFTKKDIITKTETVLNFYEKMIILLLKEGVKAKSEGELIINLSIMLNVKEKFVDKFINKLNKVEALIIENGKFKLTDELYYEYSDKDNDILLANVNEEKDDLEFAYILDLNTLITRRFIDESKVTYTEKVTKEYTDDFKNSILSSIYRLEDDYINDIINKSLNNRVVSYSEFLLEDLKNVQFNKITLPINVRYNYDFDKNCGVFDTCNIENIGNIDLGKYISPVILEHFIKKNYEFDNKKPDFILYLEKLEEEKANIKELNKLEKEEAETKLNEKNAQEEIINIENEINNEDNLIKQLNKEIKNLSDSDKNENEKINKQLHEEKEKHKETKEKLKEKNRELNKLSNERKIAENNVKAKKREIMENHLNMYKDEFEKKILLFEQYNESFYINYPKIYSQNVDVIDCLLKMFKKINNNMDMTNDWGTLRAILQNYIRCFIACLLDKDVKTIDRLKSEFSDNHPEDRMTMILLIKKENLDNLILLEWCSDAVYHKNDKKSNSTKQVISTELVEEFNEKLNVFSNLTNELQKETLLSLINVVFKTKLNEKQLNKLESEL